MTQPGWPGEDHFKQTSENNLLQCLLSRFDELLLIYFNARSLLSKFDELLPHIDISTCIIM